MDAVEFLKERERMCKHNMKNGSCHINDCPMYSLRVELQKDGPKKVLCSSVLYKSPEKAVAVVAKWSEEHKRKTLMEDFFEKYPGAQRTEVGLPVLCVLRLGYKADCTTYCKECWSTPLEEAGYNQA